jgi:hypothetical protein
MPIAGKTSTAEANSSLMTTAGAMSSIRPAPNSIAAMTMNNDLTLV